MKLLPYAIGNLVGALFMLAAIHDWHMTIVVYAWIGLIFLILKWE